MEVQIKKAVKAGNSSAVILPRAWLNKEVRVELRKKTPETILLEIINIIRRHINLKDVIGVYLTGSYARREEEENSDIDVLVVTLDTDKEMINEGIYNILVISSELLKQKLAKDLFPIGQMIKEAKPILNEDYLNSIEIKVTKKNIRWHLNTTEDKLKIVKKVLEIAKSKNKKHINDLVTYTLVLRIRTLYTLNKLIKNEGYSKKDFVDLIKKVSKGADAYKGYLAVKNNSKEKGRTSAEEVERLYGYLKNQLKEARKLVS